MDSLDNPWMVEEWDSHWGGWRKVRASWDTEQPARFATEDEAKMMAERLRLGRPGAQTRVVKG